jgi:hypothetical protein
MKLQSTSKAEASEGVQRERERERETARRDSFELKTRLIR